MLRRHGRSPWRSLRRTIQTVIFDPLLALWSHLSPSRMIRRASGNIQHALTSAADAGLQNRPRRRWMHLLIGLPALMLATAGVVATVWGMSAQESLGQTYWRKAGQALANEDYRAAQLYLMRVQDSPDIDSREVRFALAVVWDQLGHTGRSLEIVRSLAPDDRPGFPKAHKHLAILISRQRGSDSSSELLTRWLWHLTNASDQRSPEVQQAWGSYYVAVDDIPAAITAYSNAASQYPQLYLTITALHERLGQTELGRETLVRARDHFSQRLTEQPNDRDTRTAYATTLMRLGELSRAESVLRTGLRLDPDGPYKLLLAAMFTKLHDELLERESADQAVALQQLRNALQFEPMFEPALTRLLGYARRTPDAVPELRAMLTDVLASGEGTAISHLALSNLAWLENDIDVSTFHLEQAMEMDADMPVIANNLAWLLAHREPADLERARAVIDRVVEQHPENPHFLDTRGSILLKQGEYRKALVDLEKALPGMNDPGPVHERLATAYEELGMEDIAVSHRRMAEKK